MTRRCGWATTARASATRVRPVSTAVVAVAPRPAPSSRLYGISTQQPRRGRDPPPDHRRRRVRHHALFGQLRPQARGRRLPRREPHAAAAGAAADRISDAAADERCCGPRRRRPHDGKTEPPKARGRPIRNGSPKDAKKKPEKQRKRRLLKPWHQSRQEQRPRCQSRQRKDFVFESKRCHVHEC